MDEREFLAQRFEADRPHLRSVAYRMLGSGHEADDAVQEAWLRASRAGADGVENLGGWLTTIVARVCLDMLRVRTSRREEPVGVRPVEAVAAGEEGLDPAHEALLADAVGIALLVVLESLPPPERVAFVLHDLFAVPFDEIAPIVGRSPGATRQLASRARRRVQGSAAVPERDLARQRTVVDAFLAASRLGDFGALLAVLDPDVVCRADRAAVATGATGEVRGAAGVAETFAGRARGAQPALVNGSVGLVWLVRGHPQVVFGLRIAGDRIVEIDLVADPKFVAELDVVPIEA